MFQPSRDGFDALTLAAAPIDGFDLRFGGIAWRAAPRVGPETAGKSLLPFGKARRIGGSAREEIMRNRSISDDAVTAERAGRLVRAGQKLKQPRGK